ncbi:DUF1304 domain-containing protein [Breznakiella homolactica]|uniref:DUF1304 domain-containing protein n=1 Tax=Breznakiella homolactica TaxID=2798577 RepID=A0A7T7XKC2_9SPIR|nr:DUF1304 domain-containing protein [Breznakiella homolactica]QQO07842.1 DUF1304 domain-containing protein [Breznakiella homolactica]
MNITILTVCAIIGGLHLFIMILEMFAPPEKQGMIFKMPLDFVTQPNAQTALKNQGIYNGALGLAILVSLFIFSGTTRLMVLLLFMGFVFIVGIFGGKTVTKSIYFIQALPALCAGGLIIFALLI